MDVVHRSMIFLSRFCLSVLINSNQSFTSFKISVNEMLVLESYDKLKFLHIKFRGRIGVTKHYIFKSIQFIDPLI